MADVPDADLERMLDEALDDFDSRSHATLGSIPAQVQPTANVRDPNAPASENTTSHEPTAVTSKVTSSVGGKRFNPLGKRATKRNAQSATPEEPDPGQLQESIDGLAAVLEQVMQGNAGDSGPAENLQSTLQQVNAAARAAAEGSTGHAAGSSSTGMESGQTEVQQMLEAMSRAMDRGGGDADSFVETLMQGLLSKEVLYDPLRDIADRFPPWIEVNRAQLSLEELQQYERQLQHIDRICKLLEQHGDSKFDELLQLLQELQAMGQPPQELLQEMQQATGAAEATAGLPDGLPPQCPVQ